MSWPYSTHDEVSHLACEDVVVLRARIDMLLEERRLLEASSTRSKVAKVIPEDWPHLSRQEWRLVQFLASLDEGEFASKDRVTDAIVHGDVDDVYPELSRVVVCKVRKLLAPVGVSIETRHGIGYRLDRATREMLRAQA